MIYIYLKMIQIPLTASAVNDYRNPYVSGDILSINLAFTEPVILKTEGGSPF